MANGRPGLLDWIFQIKTWRPGFVAGWKIVNCSLMTVAGAADTSSVTHDNKVHGGRKMRWRKLLFCLVLAFCCCCIFKFKFKFIFLFICSIIFCSLKIFIPWSHGTNSFKMDTTRFITYLYRSTQCWFENINNKMCIENINNTIFIENIKYVSSWFWPFIIKLLIQRRVGGGWVWGVGK